MYDDPDDPIWSRILELAALDEGEADDFHVVDELPEYDGNRSLYVLAHPGDVVQSRSDVCGSENPSDILKYSMGCQLAQAADIGEFSDKNWDLAVLHRFSSSYAFGVSNSAEEFAEAIETIHEGGTVLFGDDLAAAAGYMVATMFASKRPSVMLSGAWSEAETACIATLGKHLDMLGARVHLANSACISPDGSEQEWKPRAASYSQM